MNNEDGARGPEARTQRQASREEPAPVDRRQQARTRRRWIVVTAAGVSAFAALLAAVSGVAFSVLGLQHISSAAPSRTSPTPPTAATAPSRSPFAAATPVVHPSPPGAGNPSAPGQPGLAGPPASQEAPVQQPRPRPAAPTTPPPSHAARLVVSLNATPADGGALYNRYVDVAGRVSGPRPSGQLWLVWAALPKPSDPKQVDQYYSKGEIHPAADGSFSFVNLTMGDTSAYAVHRTWRIFAAVATTAAAQQWLLDNLANNSNLAWDSNRLSLPAGVQQLGESIYVTRSS
jgi:hypothetical protein